MAPRGSSRTLSIIIAGDATGAQKAIGQVSGDVESLGGKVKTAAVDMARGWATFQGAQFLRDAAQSAASLVEAQNTVDAVFGASAASVRHFGEQAADSIGQSEEMALSAAANFGTLFQGMDVGADRAAAMSERMLTLASDMAAARNIPVDEAINALFSGLAGEQEPLKRFGVLLNEATVKAKALEMGLYSGTGQLDQSARAMATYELILERTALMHGTVERESEGLIFQQQQLTAQWEDAKAKLGMELIPAMNAAVGVTSRMVEAWSSLPGPVQVSLVALGGFALWGSKITAAYRAAGGTLTNFRLGLMGVTQQGAGASNAVGGFTRQLVATPAAAGAAVVGLGALSFMLIKISEDAGRAEKNTEALVAAAEAGGESIDRVYREKLAKTLAGIEGGFDLGDSASGFRNVLESIGISADELHAALTGTEEDFERFKQRVADAANVPNGPGQPLIEDLDTLRSSAKDAEAQQRDLTDAQKALGVETDAASDSAEGHADATKRQTRALEDQETVIERVNRLFQERTDKLLRERDLQEGVRDAHTRLTTAQEALAEAQRAATGDSDAYRDSLEAQQDAAESLVDAHDGVRDAEERVTEAQRGVLEAQRALNEARDDARQKIEDMARAARDAALSEEGAQIAVERARNELDVIMRNQSASDLDRREARLKLKEAEEEARQATEDRRTADDDAAEARRRGVEGSDEVREARERLADANRGVRDALDGVTEANERVEEAERRVAETAQASQRLIEAAKEQVVGAQRDVEDATIDVARAYRDLITEQEGAKAGTEAYRDVLGLLALQTAPGSPLRAHLEGLIEDLDRIEEGITFLERFANTVGMDPEVAAAAAERYMGRARAESQARDLGERINPFDGRRAGVSVTQNIYGSDVQVSREADRRAREWFDRAGRWFSGG